MLTLSSGATDAIRGVIEGSPDVADDMGGMRLTRKHRADGRAQFSMALVGEPEIGDEVIESKGARVFVEPKLSSLLADKQLDMARADDGHLRFLFNDQQA